jgi:hypothetical protein
MFSPQPLRFSALSAQAFEQYTFVMYRDLNTCSHTGHVFMPSPSSTLRLPLL